MPYVEIFSTVPPSSTLIIILVSSFLGCSFSGSLFIFFPQAEEKICFPWGTEPEKYLPVVPVQKILRLPRFHFIFHIHLILLFSILSETNINNKY
jgi:hypothetical protein